MSERAGLADDVALRVERAGWEDRVESLDEFGFAVLPRLLHPADCRDLAALFEQDGLFRNRVVMARHGYGRGEYRYFAYPLPDLVSRLRAALYPQLVPVANRWNDLLGVEQRYPASLSEYLEHCHRRGQTRPTPLLLRYAAGDYNRLHQDVYGQEFFPLQVAVLLSQPGSDFTGGEFVLTEQRARRQSRPMVVDLEMGDAVVFSGRTRPVPGLKRPSRAQLRHGVSTVHSGTRLTAGIIFHDAE